MTTRKLSGQAGVHCRTGSLESVHVNGGAVAYVHCRTGSLEKPTISTTKQPAVHCRTGSLEIFPFFSPRC